MTARPRSARSTLGLTVAGLLLLSGCGSDAPEPTDPETTPSTTADALPLDPGAAPETPEADLSGIPKVVARVNGESIGKAEFTKVYTRQFQAASGQDQSTGQPVDQDALKQQTIEALVGSELLTQEADRLDISATRVDIQAELDDLLAQNGLASRKELSPLLAQQGLSLDDVREQIQAQIKIDRLIEKANPGALKVTNQEIRTFYDQVAQQQEANPTGQTLPPLSEVRAEVEDQLRTEKQAQASQSLVDDLRKDAQVKINL